MNDTEIEDEKSQNTRKAIQKWKSKRGALIMALRDVQDMYGHVPLDQAKVVSEELNIPLSQIYEVLTFYNYFKIESPGKIIISVCDGTSCHIKGSEKLIDKFKELLNINVGETTLDKNFHLQVVRCLGCCGLAPVVVVNGKTYRKVTAGEVSGIIDEWKQQVEQGAVK